LATPSHEPDTHKREATESLVKSKKTKGAKQYLGLFPLQESYEHTPYQWKLLKPIPLLIGHSL